MNVTHLRHKPDYYRHEAPDWVRNIWKRPESFNWFIKDNRDALVSQGAIVRLGRDYFVDASVFPEVAERLLGLGQPDDHAEAA